MKKTIVFASLVLLMMATMIFAQYPTMSIREIQEVPIGEDSSHYEGDTVHVGGVVTAGTGLYYAGTGVSFYMEMPEGGPFSGIMAYNPDNALPDLIPGDSISVNALVSEYGYPYDPPFTSNMTELFIVPGSFIFHSFGNPEPEPVVITADLIDTVGGAGVVDSLGEQFEGVYVRVYEVTVDSVIPYTTTATWVCHDSTGHQFMVRDASDSISYLPTVGTQFSYVNGVIYHRFDIYSVQPRYMRDIQFQSGAPVIGNVGHTPEFPFNDDQVTVSANVFDDVAVDDVRLFYRLNLGNWAFVHMTEGTNNNYHSTLPVLPTNTRVDYYIEAEDNESNISKFPLEAPFNFITYRVLSPTVMTIAQAKVDIDNDFRPDLIDQAVTLTGIASSYNYSTTQTDFFMQDGTAGIDVFMSGTMVNVNIGDSITASGIIDQYNGKTELAIYNVNRIHNYGGGHHVDTLELNCDQLGEGAGEQYEGRLIRLGCLTITPDPNPWPALGVSATMTISDGTGDVMLRIDASTNIPGQNQPPTLPNIHVNIVGCLGQYSYNNPPDDGYQLMPRQYSDFRDTTCQVGIDESDNLPLATSLSQNYPNPFNPSTSIMYYLAERGVVNIAIYDILGQKVYEFNKSDAEVGSHSFIWEGTDTGGRPVATGVYFYRLKVGDFSDTRQMLLLK
jgi:hypothetical protein